MTKKICSATKKEIVFPIMDKNGNILKSGDVVYYSECDHDGNNRSSYADSLYFIESDGEYVRLGQCLVYTFRDSYREGKDLSQDPVSIEFHSLDITSNGTRVLDLMKIVNVDPDNAVEFMNENFPKGERA